MQGSRPRAVGAVLSMLGKLGVHDPVLFGLRHHRQRLAEEMITAYLPLLRPLQGAVLDRDPAATARHDELVAEAVAVMRAARPDGVMGALGFLDRRLYKDTPELLDDPEVPEAQRMEVIRGVDWVNERLGSYALWAQVLKEVLPRDGVPHVHDLCAGHGGFAVALAGALAGRARVSASDLRPEYLELGQRAAEAAGVEVEFLVQDATDLSGLDDVDLFVCTQSVHHFPPGMVSRMLGQAARAARLGVCFIDAERAWLPLLSVPALVGVAMMSRAALHDTWASVRRMYYGEELLVLARLAPGLPEGARVELMRLLPGFACVTIHR